MDNIHIMSRFQRIQIIKFYCIFKGNMSTNRRNWTKLCSFGTYENGSQSSLTPAKRPKMTSHFDARTHKMMTYRLASIEYSERFVCYCSQKKWWSNHPSESAPDWWTLLWSLRYPNRIDTAVAPSSIGSTYSWGWYIFPISRAARNFFRNFLE
jgi:hypothetical protein